MQAFIIPTRLLTEKIPSYFVNHECLHVLRCVIAATGGWKNTKGWKAAQREADLPTAAHDAEVAKGLVFGLPGASSIEDRSIPTFSRGELPHFAGINTFMKVSAACGISS
jgi:hypothetical protein